MRNVLVLFGFVLGIVLFQNQSDPDESSYTSDTSDTKRNFNIVAFGDTQMSDFDTNECPKSTGKLENQTQSSVRALNNFYGKDAAKWPSSDFGGETGTFFLKDKYFRKPDFLVLAGDVTENGDAGGCAEWQKFLDHFPETGHAKSSEEAIDSIEKIAYPVFEGLGNHDFPFVDSLDSAKSDNVRKNLNKKLIARNIKREEHFKISDSTFKITNQDRERGAYTWKYSDIHFFNLNVKPSGGGTSLYCGMPTNRAHQTTDNSMKLDDPVKDNLCQEFIVKNKKVRMIDPHFALGFLENNLVKNTQVVIISHYGPANQTRLANDELKNFCTIIEKKKVRVIAWLVGHTHRSDYYEWSCGGYTVPVFNVGAGYTKEGSSTYEDNAGEIHFSALRFGENYLEATDISYDPSKEVYTVPGVTADNSSSCNNAKGTRVVSGDNSAYNIKPSSEFQHKGASASWPASPDSLCNPDGMYGGWQVKMKICPTGQNPYNGDDPNTECF